LDKIIEKKIFKRSDHISVTNHNIANEYMRIIPGLLHKVTVIPPLLVLTTSLQNEKRVNREKIILGYFGTLYQGLREPAYLLRLFEGLLRRVPGFGLELHFWGSTDSCLEQFDQYAHLVGRSIFLHGEIARQVVVEHMAEVTVLVNIGNSCKFQLPSKLVEYMGAGKPIVNIPCIPDDGSTLLLQNYPEILTFSVGESFNCHLDQFTRFLSGCENVRRDKLREIMMPYQVEAIAQRYIGIVESEGQLNLP
jgi:glycosyltransferase involved in cell wall biosynthesis